MGRLCRRECLDHVLIFGRRHLEGVLDAYTDHYNQSRPHRGLDLDPPDPAPSSEGALGPIVRRRDILGGIVHEYKRVAA